MTDITYMLAALRLRKRYYFNFYLATFFSMLICNAVRLLRQKAGGTCLYMSQDGHWLARFKLLSPPPPKKKVSFSAANKMKISH